MMITSDDILGKIALDADGGQLGTVVKLHIDKVKKQLTGMTVDQGFLKPDLFIGIGFVKTFGVDAVLLNQVPYDTLKGVRVLTMNGTHVGVVKKVLSQGNQLQSLAIQAGKELITIKPSSIKELGKSIILRNSWQKHKK